MAMYLSWQNDFEWRFLPIKGQRNRFWFVIHGGDERRYCGENERVTLIDDDEGIPTTVFACKRKNKAAFEANFRPQIIYQFLHSALPDHAIRRYFPTVIPTMLSRIEDNREFHARKRRMRRRRHGWGKAKFHNKNELPALTRDATV